MIFEVSKRRDAECVRPFAWALVSQIPQVLFGVANWSSNRRFLRSSSVRGVTDPTDEIFKMPIVILVLTAIGGAIWWWIRNNPREALDVAQDAATTLRNAPRRIAFRRQTNQHPVEGIDDERIAICAIAQAFIELDDLPTQEMRQKLHVLVRTKLRCDEQEAEEMEVLGRWLMTECGGSAPAVSRIGKRLVKLNGSWDLLQEILMELVQGELSSQQISAIEDLKAVFRR